MKAIGWILLWLCIPGTLPAQDVDPGAPLLHVGYYDNPPKILRNDQGEPDGFWPALVTELARREGWRLAWVYGSWGELTDKLQRGEIDLLPDVAHTDLRKDRFVFNHEVVLVSWSRVYARPGLRVQTIPELQGLRVAVLKDSVNYLGEDGIEALLRRFDVSVTFVECDTYQEVFDALAQGRADVGVTNKDVGSRYEAVFQVSRTPIIFSPASLYFAFSPALPHRDMLIDRIDQHLLRMKSNNASQYHMLLDRYLGIHAPAEEALPGWLLPSALGAVAVLLVLVFGALVLNSQVRLRNSALTRVSRDKHLAENEAERQAQQLKAFFENSPTAAYIKNTLGEIQMANSNFVRLMGREVEGVSGKALSDLLPLEDARVIEEHEQNVMTLEEPQRFEEHLHLNGEPHIYISNKFPLIDRAGRVFGLGSVSLDVTRHRAEEHIRDIQWSVLDSLSHPDAILSDALQTMLDEAVNRFGENSMAILRREGSVRYLVAAAGMPELELKALNEALCCLFKAVDDSVERHLVIDVMERQCHGALQHLGRLSGTRYAHLYITTSHGEQDVAVLMHLSPSKTIGSPLRRNLYSNLVRILRLTFDRYQDRQEQALASAIYSATSDALAVIDNNGVIIRVNEAFLLLHDSTEQECVGKRYADISGEESGRLPLPENVSDVCLRETSIQVNGRGRALLERIIPHGGGGQGLSWHIVLLTDITRLKEHEAEIDFLAQHDALTRLPNRTRLNHLLGIAIQESMQEEETFALAFMDIDRFKDINETLGHAVGDEILRQIARRLQNLLRTDDFIARVGGDEFVAILRHVSDAYGLDDVLDKLLKVFREPLVVDGRELHLGVSIGTALYPDDGVEADILLRNADVAMYDAKVKGRNRASRYYPALVEAAALRFELDAAMRHGLENGEFHLLYQPQVDLSSLRLAGVEALVRWNRPGQGLVSPAVFIPIAEASGRIVEIDEWVLNEACRQARVWHDAGVEFHRISINLSALDLGRKDIVRQILDAIEYHGIAPAMLGVEVTESTVMENVEAAFARLRALRDAGVFVSIDDFGTGYSSLSYLKRLEVNELKIDKSFIDDLPLEENDRAICEAIIQMGSHLGLEVIAEGVETASQASFLQDQGCSRAQGYWFAKPQTPNELVMWMNEWLL